MNQLELLRTIEFHDMPVDGMRFEFGDGKESSFLIDFSTYDDSKSDYLPWSLQLVDLISFVSTQIEIASDSDFDFSIFHLTMDGTFKGDMVLRTGFGKRVFSISFECRTFVLSKRP